MEADSGSRVVASDHTPMGIMRNVRAQWTAFDVKTRQADTESHGRHTQVFIFDTIYSRLEKMTTWPLNYARNAGKPTPVASAITTKRVNAPRLLASMRVPKHATSHQKMRKMEALSLAHYPRPEQAMTTARSWLLPSAEYFLGPGIAHGAERCPRWCHLRWSDSM